MLATSGAKTIAQSTLSAGLGSIRRNVVSACPGDTGKEVGSRKLPPSGNVYTGKVGVGVAGAESRVDRPHLRFITAGTKFMAGQGMVKSAIDSSHGDASAAMEQAAQEKLNTLSNR